MPSCRRQCQQEGGQLYVFISQAEEGQLELPTGFPWVRSSLLTMLSERVSVNPVCGKKIGNRLGLPSPVMAAGVALVCNLVVAFFF